MDGYRQRRDHGHRYSLCWVGRAATLSGIFFDPPSTSQFSSIPATATLVKRDTSTEGNWIGTYGTQGYNVIGNASSYPAYATIQPAGESTGTWTTSTSAPQALRDASGTGRIAAEWYSNNNSFVVNVDMVDGQAHDLALYALDWNNQGRVELDPGHGCNHGGIARHRDSSRISREESTCSGSFPGMY